MKDQEADLLVARIVEKLKARREELGLSVNRTAELAGMSHVGLLQIESGARSPHLRTVVKIASSLELPLKDLFS